MRWISTWNRQGTDLRCPDDSREKGIVAVLKSTGPYILKALARRLTLRHNFTISQPVKPVPTVRKALAEARIRRRTQRNIVCSATPPRFIDIVFCGFWPLGSKQLFYFGERRKRRARSLQHTYLVGGRTL
jgi:hypothetical protein